MYEAGIHYILGLKVEGNVLKIEPCIPVNWNEYSIRYKFGNSIYNIKVVNKSGKVKEVDRVLIDGKDTSKEEIYIGNRKLEKNEILLNNNGGIHSVEAQI